MEIYIYNRNLELQGIMDTFTSLRWARKYHKSGEFELHCPLNIDTLKLLKRDNIIYKVGSLEAGYISTIQLKMATDGQEYIEARGSFLSGYLGNRVCWDRINFNGKVEDLMYKIVKDNCIAPKDITRKIDNLILGNLKNFSETINYQNSFGNLLDQLENISNTSNLGYRNAIDIKNKKIVFEVYKGIDRSISQSIIAPCIFSRDFENILEQEYIDSLNNYKNTCLIAGAGEGAARKIASITEGTGINRFELYVDARDIADEEEVEIEGEDGEITKEPKKISWSRYEPLLLQRGREKLAEYKELKTFDSKINTNGNNIYKVDYDLGDIVTTVDSKWNLQLDTRITEIEEIYEGGNIEINPIFGNSIPTILDKIKQIGTQPTGTTSGGVAESDFNNIDGGSF